VGPRTATAVGDPSLTLCCTLLPVLACVLLLLLQLPRSVSALACKGDLTFAAAGGAIHEAKRSTP
jgi:hypothetical protein